MPVQCFEAECRAQGATSIGLLSSLFTVPFHQAMGFKLSTGVRNGLSFEGTGFKYQPMKKALKPS